MATKKKAAETTAKRYTRQVVFGQNDDDILEFTDELEMKFSPYVKMLIRKDMNGGTESLEVIEAKLNEILSILNGGSVPTVAKHKETNEKSESSGVTGLTGDQKDIINGVRSIFKTR